MSDRTTRDELELMLYPGIVEHNGFPRGETFYECECGQRLSNNMGPADVRAHEYMHHGMHTEQSTNPECGYCGNTPCTCDGFGHRVDDQGNAIYPKPGCNCVYCQQEEV
jgi:hypothetical protein